MPVASTGRSVVRQPRRASALRVVSTASCSMLLAMRCRRPVGSSASATPRSAKLSDSVPPLVNTISDGSAPIRAATDERASSSTALARWPKWCTLEAFPKSSVSARGHRLGDRRIDRRGGVMVEVDAHRDSFIIAFALTLSNKRTRQQVKPLAYTRRTLLPEPRNCDQHFGQVESAQCGNGMKR